MTKAIADNSIVNAYVEEVLEQANIIADEAIAEIESTIDDVYTEMVPDLMDAIKD